MNRNTEWRHPAVAIYADHLAPEESAGGFFELLMLARGRRTAVIGAEVLRWRCHRRWIADVLVALALPVVTSVARVSPRIQSKAAIASHQQSLSALLTRPVQVIGHVIGRTWVSRREPSSAEERAGASGGPESAPPSSDGG
jgi:hypothetical protein